MEVRLPYLSLLQSCSYRKTYTYKPYSPIACFNLGSGDVEEAPALDALAKYEVFEKGGAVYVKGDEATIKASRRQPGLACKAQGNEEIVVLGG